METKTENSTEIDEIMSNFDNEINREVEKTLKSGSYFAQHSAWDFCGYVWWDDNKFKEEVWFYGAHVCTHVAESLEELKESVNNEHGWR